MFDLTTFFSVYVALVAAFATIEAFTIILGLHLAKQQKKKQAAMEAEFAKALAEGKLPEGMDPMAMMMAANAGAGGMPMQVPPGMMEAMGNPPTVSGGAPAAAGDKNEFGQYL
jgi:hypothetical protein